MTEVAFDRDKFRELIIYIAEKTKDDASFGDTKLNKVLYWSDFFSYSHLGHPITGAIYQKLEHGPAPRALKPVREELEREGVVKVEMQPVGDFRRRVTLPQRSADRDQFTEEELELVDSIIDQVRNLTAATVSSFSHKQSVGWNLVEMYEDIPYRFALVSKEEPSEATLERGRNAAARLGW